MQDAVIRGLLKGLISATGAIIVRFIYRRYKATSNIDLLIKHFNFENSTDLPKIKLCLEYWVKMKNHAKVEQVAKRLLDFDYKDKFANEEIVKAIYFNRNYSHKDKMYFNTIMNDFNETPLEERYKKAIYKYLLGIYEKQNGNDELSQEYKEESLELDPKLKLLYPEYFSKHN